MKEIKNLVKIFGSLGEEFNRAIMPRQEHTGEDDHTSLLSREIEHSRHLNPWFIPEFVRLSFEAWSRALQEDKVESWLDRYEALRLPADPAKVAVIMAGNIPMVGLHDLLCVIASGNRAMVKMSSQDNWLIPIILRYLYETDPDLVDMVEIKEDVLKGFDKVIATGSNNTSRYFEYYFGKYPSIIRKNRNSVAVVTGKETPGELAGLADDICTYFGLGCRNVSKVYLPPAYEVENLFPFLERFAFMGDHNKFRNNYDYQKSIFIINKIKHYDNGFLLFREDHPLVSPVSVVNFERYSDKGSLMAELGNREGEIQCIVSADSEIPGAIPPGTAQYPELWDYADGMDTMQFLLNQG